MILTVLARFFDGGEAAAGSPIYTHNPHWEWSFRHSPYHVVNVTLKIAICRFFAHFSTCSPNV